MNENKLIASKLFPNLTYTVENIQQRYPSRKMDQDALVTRFSPSPTGFMHIGGLYASLISERLAHQHNGVFFLRIEDTDKKREVQGAIDIIINSLDRYGVHFDEGRQLDGTDRGEYGPYLQSDRIDVYLPFAKQLIENGLAYPCFCTTEELEEIDKQQQLEKAKPGYYGRWAIWRNKSTEEVLTAIDSGLPFTIRFRSNGDPEKRIEINDLFKGHLNLPENDLDMILVKSNNLPTYHFAHVIDDHFMGTTHVLRGDEWLSSLTLHIQLFKAFGWELPTYGHISPIQKMDGSSRRKLSKRKDPEANIEYYDQMGYPKDAVLEYLLNIANSSFENWRKENPTLSNTKYQLSLKELSHGSGALLDLVKLTNIGKDVVAKLTADEIYHEAIVWAQKYRPSLFTLMTNDPTYTRAIFNIERNGDKTRKDIGKWGDLETEISFFFDALFAPTQTQIQELLGNLSSEDIDKAIEMFLQKYDPEDSLEIWLEKMKDIASFLGFAVNFKDFKSNPSAYKGNLGDIAKIYRVSLAGKNQAPDLYQMMKVMGKDRVEKRLRVTQAYYK